MLVYFKFLSFGTFESKIINSTSYDLNIVDIAVKPEYNFLIQVLVNALSSMPVLLNSLGSLNSPRCHSQQLMSMGRQVNAALCALGGFKEMVKPGCHVTVSMVDFC